MMFLDKLEAELNASIGLEESLRRNQSHRDLNVQKKESVNFLALPGQVAKDNDMQTFTSHISGTMRRVTSSPASLPTNYH